MLKNRKYIYVFLIVIIVIGGLSYYLWSGSSIKSFSCKATFNQHHSDETLFLWLNYVFEDNIGTVSINGNIQSEPGKIIDRKVFFRSESRGRVFILTSYSNVKFPDDNVNDKWLEKYEPEFFLYNGKTIHMNIEQYQGGVYIFTLGTLPTYLCYSKIKDENIDDDS